MTPERLRLAAEHLRITAQCLFESCTVNGRWDGAHPDEQQDCDEMRTLADELDAHAAHEEEIWRTATAPQKPRTKAEQGHAARMFASLGARLAQEAANMPANPANAEDESCEGYHPSGRLTAAINAMPALLAVAEAAHARMETHDKGEDYTLRNGSKEWDNLRAALASLPNPKDDRAVASAAPRQSPC